jgi:eukaryotic-like serine/threonine-protein kinase
MLNTGEADKALVYARKALEAAQELASADSGNVQARSDLAFAFTDMGDSLSSTRPSEAAAWYRKSIELTRRLDSGSDAQTNFDLADREETLASVLTTRPQAHERLRLLEDANTIRGQTARKAHDSPLDRLYLMRSYCRIADAELAVGNLSEARRYADLSLPFFNDFTPASPDMFVLRDLGLCYESLGNVQRQRAMAGSTAASERQAALALERDWYSKSEAVWKEWKRRGAATPASERERLKVERLLASAPANDGKVLAVAR